jgi:copper chaperone
MQHNLAIENVKCGGCAHTITSRISSIEGVRDVYVDVAQGQIQFEADESKVESVIKELLRLGYPLQGSLEGISSIGAKAKSLVSCAIGKVTKETV